MMDEALSPRLCDSRFQPVSLHRVSVFEANNDTQSVIMRVRSECIYYGTKKQFIVS